MIDVFARLCGLWAVLWAIRRVFRPTALDRRRDAQRARMREIAPWFAVATSDHVLQKTITARQIQARTIRLEP